MFERNDRSVLNCAGGLEESSKLGDTLATTRSFKFNDGDNNKKNEIVMSTFYKVNTGGKSVQEISSSIKTINKTDTIKVYKNFCIVGGIKE